MFVWLRLAALNLSSAGAILDLGFTPVIEHVFGTPWVSSVVSQADRKLLMIGSFTSINGSVRTTLARLNADGTLDSTYVPALPIEPPLSAIALQPDGKLLCAASRLFRLDSSGSLDSSFRPPLIGSVRAIEVQSDNRILLAGDFGVARLHPNGAVDSSFIPSFSDVAALFPITEGRVLLQFTSFPPRLLTADSNIDDTFRPNPLLLTYILKTAAQKENVLISRNSGGFTPATILRLNLNGTLDSTFQFDPSVGPPTSFWVDPNERIVMARTVYSGPAPDTTIIRLNPNGTRDSLFEPIILNGTVSTVHFPPPRDGEIVVCGNFSRINGQPRTGLARLTTTDVSLFEPGFFDRNTFQFDFNAPIGRTYNVETSTDLRTWNIITNAMTTGAITRIVVPTTHQSYRHFYRVALIQ